MQNVYNCSKILSANFDENANSMLTNDGKIVYVAKNEETEKIKSKDAKSYDFNSSVILPGFKIFNVQILKLMENQIKTAKIKEKSEKIDPNIAFDIKTCDFFALSHAFLAVQDEFIRCGVDTVVLTDVDDFCFDLLKKFSEKNMLKIDFDVFVDFAQFHIMDENCRTFRNYKNGLKIAGYVASLDGELHLGKAWTMSPYLRSQGYKGYSQMPDERLNFIIRTAIEGKKQLLVKASGEQAVDQFLRCLSLQKANESEMENLFVLQTTGLVTKKQIKELNAKHIGIIVDLEPLVCHYVSLQKMLGHIRAKRTINLKNIIKNLEPNKFVAVYGKTPDGQFKLLSELLGKANSKTSKILSSLKYKPEEVLNFTKKFCELFNEHSKGTLESGMRANFVVLDKTACEQNLESAVQSFYFDDKLLFKR